MQITTKQITAPTNSVSDKSFYKTFLDVSGVIRSTFVNRTPLLSVGARQFDVADIAALAVLSKTNTYLVGSRGTAKTLIGETVLRSVFGDRGLYLRGDINMQLKDLLIKLNLDGKTEAEIQGISENAQLNFALVDELNRVPGVLQNQFLNIADGYIEIRGRKYLLGSGYMLMFATGNPPVDGEYTGAFDEDLALLDRISLILNLDEIELAKGDVFEIAERNMEKDKIVVKDMSEAVLRSYHHLRHAMETDVEMALTRSFLMEILYHSFRYVSIGGATVDKATESGWRDRLTGEHSGGLTVSFCSDISIRMLLHTARLAFATYKIVEIESTLQSGSPIVARQSASVMDFLDAYFGSLKLALSYDRRFIPTDLPKRLGKTHQQMLDSAFADVRRTIDSALLVKAVTCLIDFAGFRKRSEYDNINKLLKFIDDSLEAFPFLRVVHDIIDSKLREDERDDRFQGLRMVAEGVHGGVPTADPDSV